MRLGKRAVMHAPVDLLTRYSAQARSQLDRDQRVGLDHERRCHLRLEGRLDAFREVNHDRISHRSCVNDAGEGSPDRASAVPWQ